MQKKYCVDFRTKQMKKNTGELPQYYVENSHDPIVTKEIHEEAQHRRPQFYKRSRSGLPFAGLVFCGECGDAYMSLTAHSTSYNDIIWKCSGRHLRRSGCHTPSLYEEMLHPIFHEVILTILNDNPGIARECITALKAVSNTPTAFKKNIIMDLVAAYNLHSETEIYLWRTIIEKVIVYPGHLLEFRLRNGTILPYQMFRISPRANCLSKPAQEQLWQAYTQGESIRSIAQRYNLPLEVVRSAIPKAERRRYRTK